MAIYALYGVAVLLALAPIAVVLAASPRASNVIYGACLVVALVLCVVGVISLLGRTSSSVTLPLGLPWLGAHFRIDALAAFFMIVVNLGGAAASLFAIGYGQHEQAPERVLPFYPAYLAGMNLVVLSDDAFSFLVSWEFMSLSSWALVVAHHWERENLRAGYIYLLMASFGTLALLLALRPTRRRKWQLCIRCHSCVAPIRRAGGACADFGAHRCGVQGGDRPLACLAAARPSGCAEPRLRSDERRDDKGRGLRLYSHRV